MPGDVAVEGPDARVDDVHLHDDVPEGLHHLHVAALRVRRAHDGGAVVVAGACREDVHVYAVGVDWVGPVLRKGGKVRWIVYVV